MAKKQEADYAEQLVNLDQGDTEGINRIELEQTSQEQPTEPETNADEVHVSEAAEEPQEQEVQWPNEEADRLFQKTQAERDAFRTRFEKTQGELENLKNLMAMTVQDAQMRQQAPPQPQQPQKPPWFEPLEANDPDSPSYKWLKAQEMNDLRRVIREEVTQTVQQQRQQTEVARQIAEAKAAYPDLTDDTLTQIAQKYGRSGAITYKMLIDWERQGDRESQITQQAKKEGIETVTRQVAKATMPSIAQVAGSNRPPEKKSQAEKEEGEFVKTLLEIDASEQRFKQT